MLGAAVIGSTVGSQFGAAMGDELDERWFRTKDEGLRKAYAVFEGKIGDPIAKTEKRFKQIALRTHPDKNRYLPLAQRKIMEEMFKKACVAIAIIRARELVNQEAAARANQTSPPID